MFGIKELSFSFLTGQPFLTALFLILLILFSIYLYRRTNPPLPRGIKFLLTALRIIAVFALFLALFEPVVAYRREYERKPRLTLLVDQSKSMDLSESGKTREERLDSLLSSPAFGEFGANFDLIRKPFAGGLINNPSAADRDRTAIGDAIEDLSQEEMAAKSEYWILFSDGISNSGASASEAASAVKTPVYSIGLGQLSSGKDISITGLDYNQVVFAGKPTEITVRLEWSGMNNDNSKIEIKSSGKILQSKDIRLAQGDLRQETPLIFTPEHPGQQTFQIAIAPVEGEISTDNNGRSFSMTVLKSKLKVLLAADHIDWEYAFLIRYLINSESVDLSTVVAKKGGGYIGNPFPSRQEELNQNDMVILYDVNLDALSSRASLFKSFLGDKGGGLMVLLGENYLKAALPRWIDDYLPFLAKGKGKLLYVKSTGRPVENYLFHPAVRLSDSRQSIREGWSNLPPFECLVPIDSINSGGEILVTSGVGIGKNEIPIMGFRNIGAGKVLAVTASPFWHWAFFGYGFGRDNNEYKTLLGGVVNWLSLREESDPIKITPDKTVYTRGEKAGFGASVYDLGFRPITGASGTVTLKNEAGKDSTVTQFVERGDGKYRAELDIVTPGRYKYAATIEKDGKKLRDAAGEIAVESYSIEEYRRKPDFETLARISQLTGGEFYHLNEADSLYL